ncbi:MAG: four helix bundle protein [Methylococcales bacterium]|nr:four helix bundle protein [Methylococcales bacterium]
MNKKFPIWRDAEALVLAIEQAVRLFARYHKYTLGQELRVAAYALLETITHAINQQKTRQQWLDKAHYQSEALKIKIYLSKSLNLYANFNQLVRWVIL